MDYRKIRCVLRIIDISLSSRPMQVNSIDFSGGVTNFINAADRLSIVTDKSNFVVRVQKIDNIIYFVFFLCALK